MTSEYVERELPYCPAVSYWHTVLENQYRREAPQKRKKGVGDTLHVKITVSENHYRSKQSTRIDRHNLGCLERQHDDKEIGRSAWTEVGGGWHAFDAVSVWRQNKNHLLFASLFPPSESIKGGV